MQESKEKTSSGGYTWLGSMKQIPLDFWNIIKKQGFSTILLCVAIAFFYYDRTLIMCKIDQCNEQMIEMYKTDHAKALMVIERNTAAWETLNKTGL